MLIEKEVIAPGQYWYVDDATGLPKKLDVTPELTKYWRDQGTEMIKDGLPIPVPYEHDFTMHPMTPKEKLLSNAGEVKEYRLKDFDDPKRGKVKDALFSVVEVQDPDAARKIGRSIRWTSPWINSFTDGKGKQWNNVISHLALTTRPRITEQTPFGSIAAALSIASDTKIDFTVVNPNGFILSRAGRLVERKRDKCLRPQYPIAFSLFSGGIHLAEDMKELKELKDDGEEKKPSKDGEGKEHEEDTDIGGLMNPMQDAQGDVKMEELLCDLLCALGVMMPENVGESEFKRALYEAAMGKIKELAGKAMASGPAAAQNAQGNTTSPAATAGQPNPIIQQEQQPMYMSLEDINKITDPVMKNIALSMYNENVKLRAEMDASTKTANSLRDAKLRDAAAQRAQRVSLLSKLSPRVKTDLEAMLALPGMALSMGEGGSVVDPMAQTLVVLEKGLADMPRLLTMDHGALSVQAQPTDETMLTDAKADEYADSFARMMGAAPEQKKAS